MDDSLFNEMVEQNLRTCPAVVNQLVED